MSQALLVMDFQNGIVARHEGADALANVQRALVTARERGIPVFFVRVAFRAGHPEVSPKNKAFAPFAAGGQFVDGDAGADLCAAVEVELPPGGRALVPTGVAIALPAGYVGLVHPRSGLAHRMGVTVLNAPGTVDAGYRGEIMVNLINHDPLVPAKIARGDRIAQLIVQRVCRAEFQLVTELSDSVRGIGGHGSTGGHAALDRVSGAVPERAMEGTA